MRDEYLIRNTHRTFRACVLALSEDNLNAISCIILYFTILYNILWIFYFANHV
jgi:hypothetical protein